MSLPSVTSNRLRKRPNWWPITLATEDRVHELGCFVDFIHDAHGRGVVSGVMVHVSHETDKERWGPNAPDFLEVMYGGSVQRPGPIRGQWTTAIKLEAMLKAINIVIENLEPLDDWTSSAEDIEERRRTRVEVSN